MEQSAIINKNEIRQAVKSHIALQDVKALNDESDTVCGTFLELDIYKKAQIVCSYASVYPEIDTRALNKRILADGKRLCLPKVTGASQMEMRELNSIDMLQKGRFGIMEPNDLCPAVLKNNIEICVVPCVACSKTGVRVGKGGGYYDRYLCGADCVKIAFCRQLCVFDHIVPEAHDIPMDIVVTGGGVYHINEK